MSFWTDARVRDALGLEPGAAPALDFSAVSTDTRKIESGALFVALRGEKYDAHDFLAAAVDAGAAAAVVDHVPQDAPQVPYYLVPDTLVALGMLARAYRRQLSARVCAITGSNGKTTTKELTRAALATRFRTHATTGNLNNLVGAPLTLLATPADAEVVVVELGTNAPGEVARLAAIAEPDACIVTGIAEEHLEGLGDLEGVLREETSILLTLPRAGFAVVSDEPPALAQRARELGARTLAAGWSENADSALKATHVRIAEDGRVAFRWQGRDVHLSLPARHNARNALLALGVATQWGADPDRAVEALKSVRAGKMRGEVAVYGNLMVLVDCYNSNPSSLLAAVDTLEAMSRPGGAAPRVAVIGTMLELGPRSAEIHRDAAAALARSALDLVVATGDFYPAFEPFAAAMGERLIRVHDPLEAFPALEARLGGNEIVLLKGSRGVALERLLPLLEKRWGAAPAEPTTSGGGEAAARGGD